MSKCFFVYMIDKLLFFIHVTLVCLPKDIEIRATGNQDEMFLNDVTPVFVLPRLCINIILHDFLRVFRWMILPCILLIYSAFTSTYTALAWSLTESTHLIGCS